MCEQSVITSIEKQKGKKRYDIFINEQFSFSVHEDILVKYRLIKGKMIKPQEWTQILVAEEKNRITQYAISYLSYRARTADELLNYLMSKGFTEEDSKVVVQECITVGYIDDEAFAGQWIASRKRNRPRGRNLLKLELLNKGIDSSTIVEKLRETISEDDEMEMIKLLIIKKLRDKTFETTFDLKKKIVPYLQRKGFNVDQILNVIEQIKQDYVT